MFTTAIKLIERLQNDPQYKRDADELRAELINSAQLPHAAYETWKNTTCYQQRVNQLELDQALETLEAELSTQLLRRFPECAFDLAACGKPSSSYGWKGMRRYAREQLFGIWVIGQPIPKKATVLIDRQELSKHSKVIEKLILATLGDALSDESKERLQEASRLLSLLK